MKHYYEAEYYQDCEYHPIGIFKADNEWDVFDWCENWLMKNHPGADNVAVHEIYEWGAKGEVVIEL